MHSVSSDMQRKAARRLKSTPNAETTSSQYNSRVDTTAPNDIAFTPDGRWIVSFFNHWLWRKDVSCFFLWVVLATSLWIKVWWIISDGLFLSLPGESIACIFKAGGGPILKVPEWSLWSLPKASKCNVALACFGGVDNVQLSWAGDTRVEMGAPHLQPFVAFFIWLTLLLFNPTEATYQAPLEVRLGNGPLQLIKCIIICIKPHVVSFLPFSLSCTE